MMIKKAIIALLIMGLATGVYIYFFMYNKSHPDYANMQAEISLGAKELFQESKDGQAVKYTGKLIEITGSASKLEINDSIYTLVFIYDEGMFGPEGIRANFLPEYATTLKKLTFPKELTLKAFCTGYNETDVILEKAVIVQP